MTIVVSRRSFLVGSVGTVVSRRGWAEVDRHRTIVLGQINLSFYAVAGAVVQELLERLGHRVEVRQGPHEMMFPLLGQGAIDLMVAAWLPEGHAAYWARYGSGAQEVATLYDGARFFWAVPDYVPARDIRSIGDLAVPSIAARTMTLIQSIGAGATITTASQQAVRAYALDTLGYTVRPGTAAEWIGAYDAALRERRWIVFPTWAPQYLNRGGRLRALGDPLGVLGGTNRAALVSPRDRLQAMPASTRGVLERVDLGLDGVTEMDWLVNSEKKTPREAARSWMQANEDRIAGWLKAAPER